MLLAALAAACIAGCAADGGGRGTGVGFSTISGNVAATVSEDSLSNAPVCPNLPSSAMVSVRGTDLAAPIESDCTFQLVGVPPGDVTLDFEVDTTTTTFVLNSVPPSTNVVLRDVRLRDDRTDVAAIGVEERDAPTPAIEIAIVADPPKGFAPLVVEFSSRAKTNAVLGFEWNFGDGSPISRAPRPVHVYQQPGDYVVQLRVSAADLHESAFIVVRVRVPEVVDDLVVDVVATPASGPPPLTVELHATLANAVGSVRFDWDFGDGQMLQDAGPVVQHTYAARKGSFLAVVTVRDGLRREAGDSFPIVVQPNVVSVQQTALATREATRPPSSAATATASPSATATATARPTGPANSLTPARSPSANATAKATATTMATSPSSSLSTRSPALSPTPGTNTSPLPDPTAPATRPPDTPAIDLQPTRSTEPTSPSNVVPTATEKSGGDIRPTPTVEAEPTSPSNLPQPTPTTAGIDVRPTATRATQPKPTATKPRPDPPPLPPRLQPPSLPPDERRSS